MSEIQSPTDAELVAAYRAGDADAFAAIYDRYVDLIYSRNLSALDDRQVAADATHDVFINAATHMEELESPDQLESWLMSTSGDEIKARGGDDESSEQPTVPAPMALRPRVLDKVDKGLRAAAAGRPPNREKWVPIAVFAIIAVVAGLVGISVSAQFEPLEVPPPNATTPPVATVSTTTTVELTTTVPGDRSSSVTTVPAGPAAIEVSTDTVDFGEEGTSASFDVTNAGGQPGEWSLVSSSNAISPSAGEGTLAAGETVTIDLFLDREEVGEGEISEMLTVTWSGGQIQIAVVGSNQANPILHNPQATPASVEVSGDPACSNTRTTVSARIRDASEFESVIVRWSPDGSAEQETAMEPIGNDMFEGVVGPFTTVRTATVKIVAVDVHGNAGGATTTIAVIECP